MDDLILTLVLLGLIGGASVGYNAYRCSSVASKMQLESDYGPIQGCMVKTKAGRWMPLSSLREFADGGEQ